MKLIEALRMVREGSQKGGEALEVFLACGFTPLHLETFFAAEMQRAFPGRAVKVATGLYGDLAGTAARLAEAKAEFALVVVEWSDLDARLGIRNPSGWRPSELSGILEAAARRLAAIEAGVRTAAAKMRVACARPMLPLPPVAFTPGAEASAFELRLREMVEGFGARMAEAGAGVISEQRLARISPPAGRWDVRSELISGFPYAAEHATAVAELAAEVLAPAPRKKGLITDLDETLWAGVAGEIGPENVAWDLESGAQLHGLYQIVLRSLAETGVLLGVASKNEASVARRALERAEMLLPVGALSAIEVSWGAKSAAVGRILRTWNISADSMAFVDDSPLELAEVAAAHPGIECLRFPADDAQGVMALLERLRDLFGKERLTEEDALRGVSLRATAVDSAGRVGAPEDLLREAEATLTISRQKKPDDGRALELVNKTNQFNLNGERITEAAWREMLSAPESLVLVGSYQDKYSVLGRIAVLAGKKNGTHLDVETWVMSCRAFSRQIEHRCLAEIFSKLGVERMRFRLRATERNAPIRDFFTAILGTRPDSEFDLKRAEFEAKCPPLYQTVRWANGD